MIEGDNYHSLSVLNCTHAQKIDVIYIDPPFNTGGSKDWLYNNNYVDSKDTYRHSKWLSMMNSRLRLARNLLTDSGFLICAINHCELANLVCLCDSIFREKNRLGIITVVHACNGKNQAKNFAPSNEFMLVYTKATGNIQQLVIDESKLKNFNCEDEESRYQLKPLMRDHVDDLKTKKPHRWYPIFVRNDLQEISLTKQDNWIKVLPISRSGDKRKVTWQISPQSLLKKFQNKEIEIVREKDSNIVLYRKYREKQLIKTHWDAPKYNFATHGKKLLNSIIGKDNAFPFPKSLHLIKDILKITTKRDSIVLDFFAGSGTTGHAVLELNAEDGGDRQFILGTNNENKIAEEITYTRLKNVIHGYRNQINQQLIQGISANLLYFQTDFIDKQATNDQTCEQFLTSSCEILCVKENTFDVCTNATDYKIFSNSAKYLVVILNSNVIEECKQDLRKLDATKPMHIYIFSYSNDSYQSDFDDLRNDFDLHHEAIPEAILQVYQRIFKAPDK